MMMKRRTQTQGHPAAKAGDFPSLGRTAEANDIPLTTLRTRLAGKPHVLKHMHINNS